jgi:uncharacterized membrane protein YkvA (DUF1232 family)
MVWGILTGVATGLLLLWVALLIFLWRLTGRFDLSALREALRLLPDVLRLVRRLAADPSLPRGVRTRLWLLLGYLVMPIDVVPDFIPVIGYADDAVVLALVLRSVVRRSGIQAIERHWPGTPEGLTTVLRAAGIVSGSGGGGRAWRHR